MTTDLATTGVAERVARGAAFLDGDRPGWHTTIDLDALDMAHQQHCILGQVYGQYRFAPTRADENAALGFKAAGFDVRDADNAALAIEWRRIVTGRREAQTTIGDRLDAAIADLRARGLDPCPDCLTPRPADGDCRPCAASADPAFGAYSDAVHGAEHAEEAGRPYGPQDRARDEATIARYEWATHAAHRDAVTPPNGCLECGRLKRGHGVQYGSCGRHTYLEPSTSTRLMRMRARRFAADNRLYLAVAARFNSLGGAR